ncbi:MAG: hypothetical protein JW797_07785 [Bradymonadales bacterium]|nr:hypothetical protein [Bradymonadales bacterium]
METVDSYFNRPTGFCSRMKLRAVEGMLLRGLRKRRQETIPLTFGTSDRVEGLRIVHRDEGPSFDSGLVVGTVRMGYGHHRIAASAYSWSLAQGVPTYLHDLLAIESPEADFIARIDKHYSRMSRFAAELGGPFLWLWGKAMSQGNLDSLRLSCRMAQELKALATGMNSGLPYLASYPLNGQIALAAGFTKVVNLVVDNYPQYFLLVPGAVNLVQSPRFYTRLRQMGVPSRHLGLVGHWVHRDIAENLETDCQARIRRAEAGAPRRILIPIGGAGAQKKIVASLLKAAAPALRRHQIRIYLNTGDHQSVFRFLSEVAGHLGIDFHAIRSFDELGSFCASRSLGEEEPPDEKPITLFHFERHLEAFSATDRLTRVADILATKPSELAFIPIPKLLLRRVGEHEGTNAFRSAELGDGTIECRNSREVAEMLSLLCDGPDLFVRMNECILHNGAQGIYHGSQRAVQWALSL